MSKQWKAGKKTVELKAEVRPSRIRRDPPHVAGGTDRKGYWRSSEWERKFAIIGIIVFALAIFIVTIGFSAITGKR